MKVSCLPVSFFKDIQAGKMTVADWAVEAKECGLDGIDLSILLVDNHTSVYLEQFKKAITNMPLVMVTTYSDFVHPDSMQREREREYLYRDIALAAQLGAKYLRMTPGQAHPKMDIKTGIHIAIESFKLAADVARRHNIQLLFENHSKPGCWQYADFSHPTDIFLEIFNGVKDTNIGINFDTCNTIAYGDDVYTVLEEVMDKIVTVHAADTIKSGELSPTVIGEGIVPFTGIFEKLKKAGFDGWICIEEASNAGVEGVKKAADFVRSTWENA